MCKNQLNKSWRKWTKHNAKYTHQPSKQAEKKEKWTKRRRTKKNIRCSTCSKYMCIMIFCMNSFAHVKRRLSVLLLKNSLIPYHFFSCLRAPSPPPAACTYTIFWLHKNVQSTKQHDNKRSLCPVLLCLLCMPLLYASHFSLPFAQWNLLEFVARFYLKI